MDKTIKRQPRKSTRHRAGPIIVQANWYQFGRGERAVRPCVESRMFLWCEMGKGQLCINGATSRFLPGDWVLLPWRHGIVYEADSRVPFLVGGVHIIPHHKASQPAMFRVAHRRDDPLAGDVSRSDVRWPGLEGVILRSFSGPSDPLALLAKYIVERFQQATPGTKLVTELAEVLIDELRRAAQQKGHESGLLSNVALRRIHAYVDAYLDQPLSIDDLAAFAGCSEASIFRWFRNHMQASPAKWLTRVRIERSAALLRSSTLSVREIGERVGFYDPFHFSRVFKRERGVSPRVYRSRKLIL